MEQDPRIRPMSPEENAAYRGVTVDESGAEPQDEARHALPMAAGAVLCAMSASGQGYRAVRCFRALYGRLCLRHSLRRSSLSRCPRLP